MTPSLLDRFFVWLEPKRNWHRVFSSMQEAQAFLPESEAILHTIGGKPTLLARRGTMLYALENRCPHEGKSLEHARIGPNGIICPFHRHMIRLEDGLDLSHQGCGKTTVFAAEWKDDGWYVNR
jgi:nitrite reductase/ring-hydroxylating ferredoxin subunit